MTQEQKTAIQQILKYGHDYIVFPEAAKDIPLEFDILKKSETEWYTMQELTDIFGPVFQPIDIVRPPFKVVRWSFDRDEGYSEANVIAFFDAKGYKNIKTPEMKIADLDWENAADNSFGVFSELEIQYVKANT